MVTHKIVQEIKFGVDFFVIFRVVYK